MNYWTEQNTDRAKALHTERYSMSMIARSINEQFGTTFTRNAVIGKLNRLGIRCGSVTRGLKAPRIVQARRRRALPVKDSPPLVPSPMPPPIQPSTEHQVGFFGLGNSHCRFPLWSDTAPSNERFYCGSPQANLAKGRPYCAFHLALAWRTREAA